MTTTRVTQQVLESLAAADEPARVTAVTLEALPGRTMTSVTGQDVVTEARRWIGTPWRHQARLRGVGVDCGGLVVCVAQAVGLSVQDHPPGYARLPDGVSLRACVERQCARVPDLEPGAVLLMRWADAPQHLAIVSTLPEGFGMIHAWAGIRRVVEHGITAEWRERIVQDDAGPLIYRLPGVAEA